MPAVLLIAQAFGLGGADLGADPVSELLETCGKTALNFLLLTLAVTPLRQITGWSQLLRLRRILGLFAFGYALAHFAIYVCLDLGLDFATLGEDIAKRPYITVGFAALLTLIPLAATSTDRAMRRMGRRWQRLHRLVYPIAVLGVWHYWWQVKLDTREPFIYASILALLLGWRAVHRYAATAWRRRAAARAAQGLASPNTQAGTRLHPARSSRSSAR